MHKNDSTIAILVLSNGENCTSTSHGTVAMANAIYMHALASNTTSIYTFETNLYAKKVNAIP